MSTIAIPIELTTGDCDLMLAKLDEVREDLQAALNDTELDIYRWRNYRKEVMEARATALENSDAPATD